MHRRTRLLSLMALVLACYGLVSKAPDATAAGDASRGEGHAALTVGGPGLQLDDEGPRRVRALAWDRLTRGTRNVSEMIRISAESDPSRAARAARALPAGERVLLLAADLEGRHHLLAGLADHPEDNCRTPHGEPTQHPGIWPARGIEVVRERVDSFFSAYRAAGGEVDRVIVDFEHPFHWMRILADGPARLNAIRSDPRFEATAEELGFKDFSLIAWGNEEYNRWNSFMRDRLDAALQAAVFEPIREQYPDAEASTVGSYIVTRDNAVAHASSPALHHETEGFGTHDAKRCFTVIGALRDVELDGEQAFGETPFGGVLLEVNQLRAIRRSSDRPIHPWVGAFGMETLPRTGQRAASANTPYWNELLYHVALHGCDSIVYYNAKPRRAGQRGGRWASGEDDQRLDQLLAEINDQLAGAWRELRTIEPVAWDSGVIASGLAVDDRVVWRFTFRDDVPGVLVSLDGETIEIKPEPGDVGAWFVHRRGEDLTLPGGDLEPEEGDNEIKRRGQLARDGGNGRSLVRDRGGKRNDDPPPPPPQQGDPESNWMDYTYWTWQDPMGEARELPNVIRMVRVIMHLDTGAEAADAVCDRIVNRGLEAGQVAIILQGYGMGGGDPDAESYLVNGKTALFQHWDDGLPPEQVDRWWHSIWMQNGIEECKAWMQEFIARYRQRQIDNPAIPDPDRFFFDSERRVIPFYYARSGLDVFHAQRSDPRWYTEELPGWNKTLDELYNEAGRISYDLERNAFQPPNQEWMNWFAGICDQATSAALRESAYDPIQQTWPDCLCSNYETSTQYDGAGTPPRVKGGHGRYLWLQYTFECSTDTLSPVFYWASDYDLERWNMDLHEASLHLVDLQMPKLLHSYGGTPPEQVMPWIQMIGEMRHGKIQTPELTRDMIATLKGYGVREFIMWSDLGSQQERHWNNLARIVQGQPLDDP